MDLIGVLPLIKPPGPTSHDVVALVRRLSASRRAGHGGTLDPAAAGVLPICMGAATRLQRYLHLPPKRYRFVLGLGQTTETGDQTGPVRLATPAAAVRPEAVAAVLQRFVGRIRQRVPAYSARRQQGVRMYTLARSGQAVEPEWTDCVIYDVRLLAWQAGPAPRALCEVTCSSGTYVRALCVDVGEAIGVGGHMAALVRTSACGIEAGECHTVEEIASWSGEEAWRRGLCPPASALDFLPAVVVDDAEALAVRHGRPPGRRVAGVDALEVAPPLGVGEAFAAEPPAARGEAGLVPLCPVRVLDRRGVLVAVALRRRAGGQDAYTLEAVMGQ